MIVLPPREVVHRVAMHYSTQIKETPEVDPMNNPTPPTSLSHPWSPTPTGSSGRVYWLTEWCTHKGCWEVPLLVQLDKDDATVYKVLGDLVTDGGHNRFRQGDLGQVRDGDVLAWAPCEVPRLYPARDP